MHWLFSPAPSSGKWLRKAFLPSNARSLLTSSGLHASVDWQNRRERKMIFSVIWILSVCCIKYSIVRTVHCSQGFCVNKWDSLHALGQVCFLLMQKWVCMWQDITVICHTVKNMWDFGRCLVEAETWFTLIVPGIVVKRYLKIFQFKCSMWQSWAFKTALSWTPHPYCFCLWKRICLY